MDKQLDKMRFRLDVRSDPVTLRIRCADSCGKAGRGTASSALEQ
jgi:hypothetical protein